MFLNFFPMHRFFSVVWGKRQFFTIMRLLSEPYEESGYVILSGELIKYAHVFRSGFYVPYLRSGSIERSATLHQRLHSSQNGGWKKPLKPEVMWIWKQTIRYYWSWPAENENMNNKCIWKKISVEITAKLKRKLRGVSLSKL